jgi:hypothetical protein
MGNEAADRLDVRCKDEVRARSAGGVGRPTAEAVLKRGLLGILATTHTMRGAQVIGELPKVEAIAATRVRTEMPLIVEVCNEAVDDW